jgi:dephospho-CoA kinase
MPGAGKSTVALFLKEKGFLAITMGDAVREEANRQRLELTDANLGKLMLRLRRDLGAGAVAHLILQKLDRDGNNFDKVVIDGIRSISEVEVLRKIGYVKLLAIHASQDIRYRHQTNRKRPDAPTNTDDFIGRDKREISVGISEAIALADESISNNELTLEQLKERACIIVDEWLREAQKSSN